MSGKQKVSVPALTILCLALFTLGAAGAAAQQQGKFREVPLEWIQDLAARLQENILTPAGPNGEAVTTAEILALSPQQMQAARQLELDNYRFMGATLDTTEILNKVGMDEALAGLGKQPMPFMGSQSISEQINQIRALSARAGQVDFIVAQAYEAQTTGPAFVELARAGAPQVHNWTTPRGLQDQPGYIGLMDADGYGQGAAAAEILAYMMGGQGEVGLIFFSLEQWTNVKRLQGAEETFARYPNIRVVDKRGFTDPAQARDIALGMLQANPNIDAVWATWMEGPATGAAEAVLQLGRQGQVIVAAPDLGGITGARFIADPRHPIVGTGDADTIEMGRNSVLAAVRWLLAERGGLGVAAEQARGLYVVSHVYPIVRANLQEGFEKQTRGALGALPQEVLRMLENR